MAQYILEILGVKIFDCTPRCIIHADFSFTDVLESISRNEAEGFDEIITGPRVNKKEDGSSKAERPSCSVGKKETEADDHENVYGTKKFKKGETNCMYVFI